MPDFLPPFGAARGLADLQATPASYSSRILLYVAVLATLPITDAFLLPGTVMPNGFGRGAGEVGGHAFEIYKLPDLATVVDILPAICSGGPENLIL